MNSIKFFQAACVMFCAVCILAVSSGHGQASIPTPTPTPPAGIVLNGEWFKHGDLLQATFKLNESISKPFKAYAVLILPDGKMLNALTMDTPPKPVVAYAPGLDAPSTYPLINRNIPNGAPLGNYEILAAFFDPAKQVTGRDDAFMLASGIFKVVTEITTPTPTPSLPDLSGTWSGTWQVTEPTGCNDDDGGWNANVTMAADGKLSGYFSTTDASIAGDVAGSYDGTTATWTVSDPQGVVTYSGQVAAGGKTVSGTFWDGPICLGTRVKGTFSGSKD